LALIFLDEEVEVKKYKKNPREKIKFPIFNDLQLRIGYSKSKLHFQPIKLQKLLKLPMQFSA
jgi:hypothetical protein